MRTGGAEQTDGGTGVEDDCVHLRSGNEARRGQEGISESQTGGMMNVVKEGGDRMSPCQQQQRAKRTFCRGKG